MVIFVTYNIDLRTEISNLDLVKKIISILDEFFTNTKTVLNVIENRLDLFSKYWIVLL